MTRQEQLVFCKKCTNRDLDLNRGMLCKLTGKEADFAPSCSNYSYDESIPDRYDDESHLQREEMATLLSDKATEALKKQQNYPAAILTGIVAGFICALIWAVVSISTGYQIGLLAVGIGFAVGISMGVVGKGVDQIFGITGGAIALLSCVLGNFFTIIGMYADYEGLGYIETLMMFDYSQTINIMAETFSAMDVLFYAIAIFEGYKYSFRKLTEKDIHQLNA